MFDCGAGSATPPTSNPMLPFKAILIGFEWFDACINVVKWLIPISSNEDFLRPVDTPTFGSPCLNELERRSNISLSIYSCVVECMLFHIIESKCTYDK